MNISFLASGFLYGLAALSIPVIIHLFSFRRYKKVYFSDTRFLRELKEQTQSQSRLKHLLVLTARLLTLFFIVLAFAQPYIPFENAARVSGKQYVSIFIDNSFSMDAASKDGLLLEVAKNKAQQIVNAYSSADNFQLLTNDFEGRQQRFYPKDQFLELLSEVQISPASRKLHEVVTRQKSAWGKASSDPLKSYIVSDFQESFSDVSQLEKADTSTKITLVPLRSGTNSNIYIDSCWFEEPLIKVNTPCDLYVRISNTGDAEAIAIPVKLNIDNEQKGLSSVNIPAQGFIDLPIKFSLSSPGWKQAIVNISDYPITFDDNYYISFNIPKELKLLNIEGSGASKYVDALFKGDSFFKYSRIAETAIDYSQIAAQNIVVLNELNSYSSGLALVLKKYLEEGGTLFIIPGQAIDLSSYNTFLASIRAAQYDVKVNSDLKVSGFDEENALYKGVFEKKKKSEEVTDLPLIKQHYPLKITSNNSSLSLISLPGNEALLSKSSYSAGSIYQLSSSLSSQAGNFAEHALFIPTVYQMALLSGQSAENAFYVGLDNQVTLKNPGSVGEEAIHIKGEDEKDFIPGISKLGQQLVLNLHNQLTKAGNYSLKNKDSLVAKLSFNYSRQESKLDYLSQDQLQQKLDNQGIYNASIIESQEKSLSSSITEANLGKRLWKLCILLALLFITIEIALIKFWKS